jgi:hypothetical protein
MSFFSKLSGGANNLQKEYLGETYEYHKNINSPPELGMSSKGNLDALAKNVGGIVNYTELLITGSGRASKTGKPLGNKFFLATGGKCEPKGYVKSNGKLVKSGGGNETTRYLYINNQPDGKIPFLPVAGDFRGMIPGVIGNLGALNPIEIMGGFTEGSKPPCYKISLPTIDANNRRGSKSHYISKNDLKNMSGCSFPGGYNPVTKRKTYGCKQGFDIMQKYINKEKETNQNVPIKISNDLSVKLYTSGFGLLMIYLLFKFMKKN